MQSVRSLGTRSESKMLDDRICPACQVLLREGIRICPKCGRAVEPEGTGVGFIDWPIKLYPWLAHHLGPVWGGLAAAVVVVLLFLVFFGSILLMLAP
jgi:hypothetical protein